MCGTPVAVLIPALDLIEWSVSRPGRFSGGEGASGMYSICQSLPGCWVEDRIPNNKKKSPSFSSPLPDLDSDYASLVCVCCTIC